MRKHNRGRSGSEKIDPIMLQVVRSSLETACQETAITLMKAAYTPIVKEGADFGTALFDAKGEMIGSAGFVMSQSVTMPFTMKALLEEYPGEEMRAGDAFITNDPYLGSNHLPDVTLIAPYVEDGELLTLFANRTHWSDVGGMFPGSMSGSGTEIYQEGVRIPILKIASRDIVDREVLSLITANMRIPEDREGDLRAQIASNRTGMRKLAQSFKRYGKRTMLSYADALKDYAEKMTRHEIDSIPDGSYESVDFMDNDGVDMSRFVKLKLRLTVKGSHLTADFTGSDPQSKGAVNLTFPNTVGGVIQTMRFVFPPYIPLNEGCFRPVDVIAPEGTIVNARFPAAVALGPTGLWRRIRWAYFAALAQVLPKKVAASEYSATGDFLASGHDPRDDRQFVLYTLWEGGSGGVWGKDGMHAIRHGEGALMNTPAEILESEYPILVEAVALRKDSAGAGLFRGGLGIERRYRALSDFSWSIASERNRISPFGLFGGRCAARAEVLIERTNGETTSISQLGGKVARVDLHQGDVLVLRSPGGGGYGHPLWRDPVRVQKDCREGCVSPERARAEYGVVLEGPNLEIDIEATVRVREELRPGAVEGLRFYDFGVPLPEIEETNAMAIDVMGIDKIRRLATADSP